jgi:hypothetical protein
MQPCIRNDLLALQEDTADNRRLQGMLNAAMNAAVEALQQLGLEVQVRCQDGSGIHAVRTCLQQQQQHYLKDPPSLDMLKKCRAAAVQFTLNSGRCYNACL